ncbi:Lrp/AsnC family transcriptional regulator [Mesorhizobium sp. WSM4887]|uniref:Lrp/AsnC family transcriptional regulator n=1 Tax=Mesorhizobium sp. WSM4887 TaxID=3038543 RepID=UPI002416ADDD|nr:Lrp/AsnC family transcriptional regulator [Mesorhizobium sp. WSM4887]MDG4891469.1 Lrp/AsnC family transcriptional regulator [Mesorhizobium sp. WSM4887]
MGNYSQRKVSGARRKSELLDQFDRTILEIMQRDCQMKAEAIGEMVGLSASAVQRRIKRMREERIISAEIALVDRKVAGSPMTFIVGMEIERENYDALSKFRAWVEKQDHIQQVYYVTGSVDLVAIITAQDVEQYDEITAQIMSQNPQIKRMHTNVVLKDIKTGMFVPVSP